MRKNGCPDLGGFKLPKSPKPHNKEGRYAY